MIRKAWVLLLALSVAGCVSTGPSRTAGCSALVQTPADSVFVEDGASSLFDARLISGRFTGTRSGCLFEGVAPSPKVAEAQALWLEARARALCAGVIQRRKMPPAIAYSQTEHEFALEIVPDPEAPACEPYPEDPAADGGLDVAPYSMNPPRYPPAAVRRGLEGVAVLLVQTGVDGKAEAVLLVNSSGHAVLDDEALWTTARWLFHPARDSSGEPVGSMIRIPVDFSLQ